MDIKGFLEKNKKYIIYITFGIFLMMLPSMFSVDKITENSEEQRFEAFLEKTYGVGEAEVMISKDKNGDIEFDGKTFSLYTQQIGGDADVDFE